MRYILGIILSFILATGCESLTPTGPIDPKLMSIGLGSEFGVIRTITAPKPKSVYISFNQILKIFAEANPQAGIMNQPVIFVNQFTNRKVDPVTNGEEKIQVSAIGTWFIRLGDM